jgi:cytochrome c peroxidase
MVSNSRWVLLVAVLVFTTIFIYSCNWDDDPVPSVSDPTPYEFPNILGFPTKLNIPEDNPTTVEGVELGRLLFYDGRLSGRNHPDSLMSCATCHVQSYGFDMSLDHTRFSDGFPIGIPDNEAPEGRKTNHTVLPIVNTVYNDNGYFWNGLVHRSNSQLGSADLGVPADPEFNFLNIESLAWLTIVAPDEINGDINTTVETIANIPLYPPKFEAAFGTEEVTAERIGKSIAQFVRTIISYRTKFHRYVRGEAQLTDSELRGYNLFFSEDADCFHCHGGSVLMTTNLFYNNAKDSVFTDPFDRNGYTGDPTDIGAYKAPSLINVEIRAPYMHDGRFQTLEEVIDHYSEGLVNSDYVHPLMKQVSDGGVHLSPEQKADLKAFLLTLTDHELIADPAYGLPEEL